MTIRHEQSHQSDKLVPLHQEKLLREGKSGTFFLPITSEQWDFLIHRTAGIRQKEMFSINIIFPIITVASLLFSVT